MFHFFKDLFPLINFILNLFYFHLLINLVKKFFLFWRYDHLIRIHKAPLTQRWKLNASVNLWRGSCINSANVRMQVTTSIYNVSLMKFVFFLIKWFDKWKLRILSCAHYRIWSDANFIFSSAKRMCVSPFIYFFKEILV